jgi:hypothetical protein
LGGFSIHCLAMHDALAVEEELGDVGEGGGVAAGDAMVGEIFQEVGQEEIDGGGLREVFRAGEESGGDGFDGLGALRLGCERFGLGAGVEGAERGVARGQEHTAAAAGGGVVLAERVGVGFRAHKLSFLCWFCGAARI